MSARSGVLEEESRDETPTPGATPAPVGPVFPSRYQVGLVTVLGAIFLIALAPKLDTDLWWHLWDGSYIWRHASIPSHDFLSFTFAGHRWTDHEWLTELILWGLYRAFGLWGTIVAFAAVICATFALVYRRMRGLGANPLLGLFVLVGAFVASSSTWGARPQMLSLLFLAVYALLLDAYVRRPDRRLLAGFPVVMLAWANLHGGWILGLVLMGITLLGEEINRRRGHPGSLPSGAIKALAAASAVTALVTLINPYGLQQALYPLVWIFPSAYSNVLNEWVSSNFHEPVFMVFEGLLLVTIVTFYLGRAQLNWTHLLVLVAFTHLALSQSRNVAVWSVVVSPILALYLHQSLFGDVRPAAPHRMLRRRTERLVNIGLLALVCVLYPVEAFHFVSAPALRNSERATYPEGAMSYLLHRSLPQRTFTSYAWGGYLLWKGYPRYRDFIDGRANTLFDTRILNDYLSAYAAGPTWQPILDRRRVENVLVDPSAPIAQALAENKGWTRVYRDSVSVLYTRRSR